MATVRRWYEGSWPQDLVKQLVALDFFDRTTVIGAELLWSALPFIILLSSLANERIDDDISRHIGLDHRGALIVQSLFRGHPTHAFEPVATGFLISFAGIVAVIQSIQVVYERLYEREHHGWRDLPRYLLWTAILVLILAAESSVQASGSNAAGEVLQAVVTFVLVTVFIAWTIRFLLHGKERWSHVMAPAVATATLWVVLALFSSTYFSSLVVEDSHLYGTIGVVFSFLSWFILIGGVIVLGAAIGRVWQVRHGR